MNTSRFLHLLRVAAPLLSLVLMLGLTVACNGYKDPMPPEYLATTPSTTADGETLPDSTDTSSEDASADESADEDASTDEASTAEPDDDETVAGETSADETSADETSAPEETTEEETTAPLPVYTVIATNACGSRLSGILITVYEDVENGRSIVNGITDEYGVFTFRAPTDAYCATAIQTGFYHIVKTASFEANADTLTIALGDHPANCECTTAEETANIEP